MRSVLVLFLMATGAVADDRIVEQLRGCISLSPATEAFSAQVAMSLESGRLLRVKVEADDALARAITRGAERCTPFGALSGVFEFELTDEDILGAAL